MYIIRKYVKLAGLVVIGTAAVSTATFAQPAPGAAAVATSKPTEPTVIVTWRAVQVNGAWKIELPQCATPEVAASLKAGLATRLDAVAKTTAAIDRGEFGSARQALTTLSNPTR